MNNLRPAEHSVEPAMILSDLIFIRFEKLSLVDSWSAY